MGEIINLQKVREEKFGNIECDFYKDTNSDEYFMTINQLAQVLEYSSKDGVEKILKRNPYLRGDNYSTTYNLSVLEGNRQVTRERIVFTEQGVYDVALLSGKPKGREFRLFVGNILKELRRTGVVRLNKSGLARIDFMRNVLDSMEETIEKQREMQIEQQRQKQKLKDIDNKVDDITSKKVPEDYLNAAKIAAELGLTSSNDRLHAALVGKIAKYIGIRTEETAPYEDEYIKIVFGDTQIGQMIYYSPKAIETIRNWWNLNKEKLKYETYYQRNAKYGSKGDLKERGYKIGKSRYATYKSIDANKSA